MWWPLRNQILVPLLAIVTVSIAATAAVTATLAARRGERQALGQLRRVIDALGRSNFPFTPSVLDKMRGLSGAHFVAFDAGGRVTASTVAGAGGLPTALGSSGAGLDSWHGAPALDLDGDRYLAARLGPSAGTGEALLVLYPEASRRQVRWEAAWPPLAVGAGAIGLVGAASVWIARRLGARLRSVQTRVAAIAAGDFAELDPGPRRDEVRELVLSVNRMSAELRRMRDEVRRTERAGVLAQLAAGLAHQLRNGLTGARLAVQVHDRRCPGKAGDDSLGVALRQLALTEEQVKGLLALGRTGPRPAVACAVGPLLGEVARLVGPACEHARVTLDRPGEFDAPGAVRADPEGLLAALLNLTLNAVEAAGPGGRVALSAGSDGGRVCVEVADDGPGPPAELGETLFDPFVTGKPEGVGLGLALARRVAAEHGGELSWRREGKTTTFRLAFPEVVAAAKAEARPA